MSKVVRTWDDLVGLETDEYYLDIDIFIGKGHIRKKLNNESVMYLTTHSFYESKYSSLIKWLREYGFDVVVDPER